MKVFMQNVDRTKLNTTRRHIGAGWSSDNMAFGSGGGLLQKLNRDTQKCAFKCAMAVVDGEEREVFKDPITDPGKKSKKGRLSIHQEDGGWVTKMGHEVDEVTSALVPVFEVGNERQRVLRPFLVNRCITPPLDPAPSLMPLPRMARCSRTRRGPMSWAGQQ